MPYVDSGGVQLYYEEQGHGDGLLFLHGLGSSGADWAAQVPYFARRYRVVTLDLRGHGRSDKPPGPYTIAGLADDVAAVIAARDLVPAHVVGVSLGGMVAFQLAVSRAELVRSLVIVNSGPDFGAMGAAGEAEIAQRLEIVRTLGMQAMGEAIAPRLFPAPEHAALRADFVTRWAANDPAAYAATLRAFAGWNVADQLDRIQCPVLVLAAEHDYTPVAVKEAYVAKLANATLVVIPNSRHALPVERPHAFNGAVAMFLARSR